MVLSILLLCQKVCHHGPGGASMPECARSVNHVMTTKNIGVKNHPNNLIPIILLKTAISKARRISYSVVRGSGEILQGRECPKKIFNSCPSAVTLFVMP